jgi:DNA-binding NarL/FixJ family response regulator
MTRILIADDHEGMRKTLRSLLESRADFMICGEAADGIEAINKTKEMEPDLLVLDISMPNVDGLEAARVIRKFFPAIRILILSVHRSSQILKEAQKIGVNRFVEKSENGKFLLKAIDEVLNNERFFAASAGY